MAHALSLVGERWSLLIVRELLHGPKRYTDLTHGLPGIGTNILAARLETGSLEASLGAAVDADVLVETDMDTFFALTSGELEPREAVKSGRARVEGDVEALDRCFRVLSLAPRVNAAA